MKKLIRQGDDPVLKEICTPVDPKENIKGLLELMERACKKAKTGVGLAAPQVGVTKRVIYTLVKHKGTIKGRFFVNPVITASSTKTSTEQEGCLSYPGVYKYIERAETISLQYMTPTGVHKQETISGYEARVVQHEIQHLDGKTILDEIDLGPPQEKSFSSATPLLIAGVN